MVAMLLTSLTLATGCAHTTPIVVATSIPCWEVPDAPPETPLQGPIALNKWNKLLCSLPVLLSPTIGNCSTAGPNDAH